MKQIKPLDQLKWMAVTIPTAAAFSWAGFGTLDTLGFDVPRTVIEAAPGLGATAALGYYTLYQFGLLHSRPRQRRKPALMESLTRLDAPASDPDARPWLLRYKEQPEAEFMFYGLGLPGSIPETTLSRFAGIAWRRWTNAVWDNTLVRDGSGRPAKLTANQVFSRRHFTKTTNPRFLDEEYDGCVHILVMCGMIIDRGPGKGGRFSSEKGPHKIVDACRRRWRAMLRPPARRRASVWRLIGQRKGGL